MRTQKGRVATWGGMEEYGTRHNSTPPDNRPLWHDSSRSPTNQQIAVNRQRPTSSESDHALARESRDQRGHQGDDTLLLYTHGAVRYTTSRPATRYAMRDPVVETRGELKGTETERSENERRKTREGKRGTWRKRETATQTQTRRPVTCAGSKELFTGYDSGNGQPNLVY